MISKYWQVLPLTAYLVLCAIWDESWPAQVLAGTSYFLGGLYVALNQLAWRKHE